MQLDKKYIISPWKYLKMHFSRALEYKLQPVSSKHLVVLCVAAHSSRCLRHTAMWEWHHKDAGIQCRGKPRVQPQSHLLQEIPRRTHLYRGLTHSYHLYNVHYICTLTVCSHSQCVCCCAQVWSRGMLWDSVLGEARLQTAESERSRSHVIDLRGGRSRLGCRRCVYVETSSSICLTDLWHVMPRQQPSSQVDADEQTSLMN